MVRIRRQGFDDRPGNDLAMAKQSVGMTMMKRLQCFGGAYGARGAEIYVRCGFHEVKSTSGIDSRCEGGALAFQLLNHVRWVVPTFPFLVPSP